MVNTDRGSFWEQQAYVAGVAVVIAVVVAFAGGKHHIVWAYLFGALYGMASYECWVFFLNNFGSMFYDEGEEPETLDWRHGFIALLLPAGLSVALVVSTICFAIAWLWYLYDWTRGHYRTTR